MSKKKKAKNATQVVKGKVEEAAGKATGDERLEQDGRDDQMMGNLKQAGEKLKDAVKK
jgi:uncharacterized protein YjbJ (UPF0337 family)